MVTEFSEAWQELLYSEGKNQGTDDEEEVRYFNCKVKSIRSSYVFLAAQEEHVYEEVTDPSRCINSCE